MSLIFIFLCLSAPVYQPFVQSCRGCTFSVFLCPIISSTHDNVSIIISIFMQERSLYITTLKMNGSELLFVYNNVEMVAAFVVYLFT